jgi:hypothetical protein
MSTWSTSALTPTVLATSGDYQLVSVKYPLFVGGSGIGISPRVRTVVTGSVVAGSEQTANVTYGNMIGPTSRFSIGDMGFNGSETHTGLAISQFQLGEEGTFGYGFELVPGGPTYYGSARITVHNDGLSATLHDWHYENVAGMSIFVIPEPSRALLTLVGMGMVFLRRRRRAP